MCGKGSNQTTSSTSTAPNPQAMGAYSNLLAQASQVAATPYQAYGGQLVAPVNQQQNLGIGNINQYANAAQPAINQAMGYANQAAQPVTGAQIQQYQSPYTQQVVNATQAQFANQNAQQQSALQGNAISQGALGGNRAGVAAANLAGQQSLAQAPVIAGLYNQGYQNAQQMALAEQQQQANAAYSLGNLGVAGQGAGLQGAGAQIGAGTLQQQTQQAQDLAAYQQFLQQQAYPFQTLSWESGIDTGVGSQMGGTSQTTTQGPPPNPFNQIGGLALLGAGIFGKDGGRIPHASGGLVGYDTGGAPYQGGVGWNPNQQPYAGAVGYVPTQQITMGQGAPHPSGSGSSPSNSTDFKGLADAYKLGKGLDFNKSGGLGSAIGDMLGGPGGLDAIDYAEGGPVIKDYIYDPEYPDERRTTPWGGGIRGLKPQGFAIGGDPNEDTPDLSPAAHSPPDPNAEWNAFRQDVQNDPTSSVNAQPQGIQVANLAPATPAGVAPESKPAPNYANATKKFEGFAPVAKWDYKQNSNGYGTRAAYPGEKIDPQTAESRFQDEYWKASQIVNKVNPNLDPGSRAALTDLTYNAGASWTQAPLGQAVAAGDINKAKQLILGYNHAGGQALPALTQRRAANASWMGSDASPNDNAELPPNSIPTGGAGLGATAQNQPQGLASDQGFLGKGGLFNMEGATRQGLVAAGLGMLASKSPYAGVGIGEGGLQGLQAYQHAKGKDTDVDLAHTKLTQAAKFHQDALEQESKKLQQQEDIAKANREERSFEHQKPFVIDNIPNPNGLSPPTPVLGHANPDKTPGAPPYVDTTGKPYVRPEVPGTPPAGQPQNTPANPPVPPTAPAQPGAPVAGQQPYQVASADGIIPANNKIAEGPYDYSKDGPYLEKGMDVPEPQPVSGRSSGDIKTQGEYYLQTGKLPPVSRGNSPVAVQQELLRRSVENYGTALAQSRGLSPQETAEMWRSAPGMLRFVLGPDGRSTVSLGTAVRHLDTLEQYATAWQAVQRAGTPENIQTLNRIKAAISREFGSAAATNLQTAANIVGPEIVKAIGVAGAGTDAERSRATAQFTAAQSPEQLFGATNVTKGLLGGQLKGRRQQASEAGVDEARFKRLIGERAYEVLTNIDKGGAGAAALPEAAKSRLKEGMHTTFGNGQVWTLENGQPKQVK